MPGDRSGVTFTCPQVSPGVERPRGASPAAERKPSPAVNPLAGSPGQHSSSCSPSCATRSPERPLQGPPPDYTSGAFLVVHALQASIAAPPPGSPANAHEASIRIIDGWAGGDPIVAEFPLDLRSFCINHTIDFVEWRTHGCAAAAARAAVPQTSPRLSKERPSKDKRSPRQTTTTLQCAKVYPLVRPDALANPLPLRERPHTIDVVVSQACAPVLCWTPLRALLCTCACTMQTGAMIRQAVWGVCLFQQPLFAVGCCEFGGG